jgi:hypothetical protein
MATHHEMCQLVCLFSFFILTLFVPFRNLQQVDLDDDKKLKGDGEFGAKVENQPLKPELAKVFGVQEGKEKVIKGEKRSPVVRFIDSTSLTLVPVSLCSLHCSCSVCTGSQDSS